MARPRKNPEPSQQALQTGAEQPEQPEQPGNERLLEVAAGFLESQTQVPADIAIEPLEDFLRRVERVHIERDVVATAATHPHATERVWPGTYGGIRLALGPVSVTYSDGTTE